MWNQRDPWDTTKVGTLSFLECATWSCRILIHLWKPELQAKLPLQLRPLFCFGEKSQLFPECGCYKQRSYCQNSPKWEGNFLPCTRSGTRSKFCFRLYVSPSTIFIVAFNIQHNEFLSIEDRDRVSCFPTYFSIVNRFFMLNL